FGVSIAGSVLASSLASILGSSLGSTLSASSFGAAALISSAVVAVSGVLGLASAKILSSFAVSPSDLALDLTSDLTSGLVLVSDLNLASDLAPIAVGFSLAANTSFAISVGSILAVSSLDMAPVPNG